MKRFLFLLSFLFLSCASGLGQGGTQSPVVPSSGNINPKALPPYFTAPYNWPLNSFPNMFTSNYSFPFNPYLKPFLGNALNPYTRGLLQFSSPTVSSSTPSTLTQSQNSGKKLTSSSSSPSVPSGYFLPWIKPDLTRVPAPLSMGSDVGGLPDMHPKTTAYVVVDPTSKEVWVYSSAGVRVPTTGKIRQREDGTMEVLSMSSAGSFLISLGLTPQVITYGSQQFRVMEVKDVESHFSPEPDLDPFASSNLPQGNGTNR